MTPTQRQAARDRAADAIAPRDRVYCGPDGWAPPLTDPMLSAHERIRRYDLSRRRNRPRASA